MPCKAYVLLANESKCTDTKKYGLPRRHVQVPFREGKMLRKKQLLVGKAGARLRSCRKQAASGTCTTPYYQKR